MANTNPVGASNAEKLLHRTINEQLDHDITSLKEIMLTMFAGVNIRFDAMDKAVRLFEDNLTRVPTDVDKQVGHLRELLDTRIDAIDKATELLREVAGVVPSEADKAIDHQRELSDEKFASIAIQFRERDTRTEQTSKDSKVAVDAALQAAKEAVGKQQESNSLAIDKSETATRKQIDQIGELLNAANKATADKIDDLKQRITTLESRSEGHKEQVKGNNDLMTVVIGGILALVGIAALVVSMVHK